MAQDCGVVVVAAGKGERFGGGTPKQYRLLAGRPVYQWSLQFFAHHPRVCELVLVVAGQFIDEIRSEVLSLGFPVPIVVVGGGERRQDSVENGVRALSDATFLAAIHDAARPFPPRNFDEVCDAARTWKAAICACPIVDTVKRCDDELFAFETVDRSRLWAAQTPQVFHRELLLRALEYCRQNAIDVTDDAAAVALLGVPTKLVPANRWNIKITTAEDLQLAEMLLSLRERGFFHLDQRDPEKGTI